MDASVRGNRSLLDRFSLLRSGSDWRRDSDVTRNDSAWRMRQQKDMNSNQIKTCAVDLMKQPKMVGVDIVAFRTFFDIVEPTTAK